MNGARWWLVFYDVRDPKRLRLAAKHLEGYGERIQYSVFRLWQTAQQVRRLRWELTEMLEPEDDVMVIPICPRCASGVAVTHPTINRPDWPDAPEGHVIA